MEEGPSPDLAPPAAKAGNLSAVLALLFVLGLLGSAYAIIFYAGPYRWLAELQLHWFDAYYPGTTAVFTVILLILPTLVAIRLLTMRGALPARSLAALLASSGSRGALRARFGRARTWLIVLGVGVTMAVMSTRDLYVAARGEKLLRVPIGALEKGAAPKSTWLRIDGKPLWESSLTTEERREQQRYVPVVSDGWQPGTKVGALLRFAENEADSLGTQPLQGTVDITGVPGMVRSKYEESQFDVSEAVLLDVGKSPSEKAGAAWFIMAIASLLVLLGGVVSFIRLR
jgi:hypothetical protein